MSKEQKQGLTNFVKNIRETMHKVQDGDELNSAERASILNFYLEVVHVLATED